MPGKVNPVIPEVVMQVAAQVIGNDTAITIGGMGPPRAQRVLPVIARNLLESMKLLASASPAASPTSASTASRPTASSCERYVELTLSAATALNPYIGYDKAAEIVKEAVGVGPLAARGRAREGVEDTCSTRRSTIARWRSRTRRAPSIESKKRAARRRPFTSAAELSSWPRPTV